MAFGARSSLRDDETFPSLPSLADEGTLAMGMQDLDGNYFDPLFGKPLRHWAFLGEIQSFNQLVRLMLYVRDRDGNECKVALHTDDRGQTLLRQSKLLKGYDKEGDGQFAIYTPAKEAYTVVVLYGYPKVFLDMSTGFRVEHDKFIKVIPHSLATLLAADDILREDRPQEKCFSCTKAAGDAKLLRCSGCMVAVYCNKECQAADWRNSHKTMCKALVQVKWFAKKDWDTWKDSESFTV